MPHKWHVIAKLQLGKEDDRRGQGQQWILDSSLGLTIGLSSVHALGKGQGLPHYHDRAQYMHWAKARVCHTTMTETWLHKSRRCLLAARQCIPSWRGDPSGGPARSGCYYATARVPPPGRTSAHRRRGSSLGAPSRRRPALVRLQPGQPRAGPNLRPRRRGSATRTLGWARRTPSLQAHITWIKTAGHLLTCYRAH